MMDGESILLLLVALSLIALLFGLALRYFRQPPVSAYILTGMVAGPHVLGIVEDAGLISQLGGLGVVMLLFFVGMRISPKKMLSNWKVALAGTLFQVIVSILCVAAAAIFMGWPPSVVILFGFVISLSSTAVVLRILEGKNETRTRMGQDSLSILLAQDLAVIPMIIILTFLAGTEVSKSEILLQIAGFIVLGGFVYWMVRAKAISIPFSEKIVQDREFRLLGALAVCFGFALVSGFFHLSMALGAFIAGIFVRSAKQTKWVAKSLGQFKTLFLALFFVSIGLLIRLGFVIENLHVILVLVLLVFLTNTFINAAIFRMLGGNWKYSMYAGSLLAQIGEFSFILIVAGLNSGLIGYETYELVVAVIASTLLLSPMWMQLFSSFSENISGRITRIRGGARKSGNYRHRARRTARRIESKTQRPRLSPQQAMGHYGSAKSTSFNCSP
ncbi:cation:proton antiporter, partial [Candidatus Micrarchaeota archaeon]|nr:cation:proton antiporter [Candidatus Micrarchaeota archaeon]